MEAFKRLRNNQLATFFNVQHEGTVVRGSCTAQSGLPIMHTTSQSALLVFALGCLTIQGCGPSLEEVRSYEAEEGDLLVRNGNTRIELTQAFKPGEPNGLFDGGVAVISQGTEPQSRNRAVCGMLICPTGLNTTTSTDAGWRQANNPATKEERQIGNFSAFSMENKWTRGERRLRTGRNAYRKISAEKVTFRTSKPVSIGTNI